MRPSAFLGHLRHERDGERSCSSSFHAALAAGVFRRAAPARMAHFSSTGCRCRTTLLACLRPRKEQAQRSAWRVDGWVLYLGGWKTPVDSPGVRLVRVLRERRRTRGDGAWVAADPGGGEGGGEAATTTAEADPATAAAAADEASVRCAAAADEASVRYRRWREDATCAWRVCSCAGWHETRGRTKKKHGQRPGTRRSLGHHVAGKVRACIARYLCFWRAYVGACVCPERVAVFFFLFLFSCLMARGVACGEG